MATLTLDGDVTAAVEHLRAKETLAFDEALNRLVRAGAAFLAAKPPPRNYIKTFDLGPMVDVSNVSEALELIESDGR